MSSDLVAYNDEFAAAQAEMQAQAGESANIDYLRFNPTAGSYVFSDDDLGAPLKLRAVICYSQQGQKLWPNENDTKIHSLGLMASPKPLCQANSVKFTPKVSEDAPVRVLESLGWDPSKPCEVCPLRQFDENLRTTPCQPQYRVAIVIVDKQGKPLNPDGFAVLTLGKFTAFNAFKKALREILKKGATTDSVVEFSAIPSGHTKAPQLKVIDVASPELREHCRAVAVLAHKMMSKPPRAAQQSEPSESRVASTKGPAMEWEEVNLLDPDDAPF